MGTIGAGGRAQLDRHGVIRPEHGRWSLDWWVGASDQWHLASAGALVRQSLVDATPVVLSAMRVPGGEFEQRAWSAVDGATGRPELVVEFTNATTVPVVLALAVSGSSHGSVAPIVDLVDGVVTVDGEGVALFTREPSRYGFEVGGRSTVELTTSGDASITFPEGGVRSSGGTTTVSFVFPVPHTATLRVVLPLTSDESQPLVTLDECRRISPAAQPPAERVVAGWKAQLARAPRFDLPERRIEEAIDGARAHLLVHAAGEDPLRFPGVTVDGVERSEIVMALDEQGLFAEGLRLLEAAADLQDSDGSFDRSRLDATASWIVAVERHVSLTEDRAFAETMAVRVASAAHWLSKRMRGRRLQRSTSFFARGDGPSSVAPDVRAAYDARWTRRAFRSAIAVLDFADQPDAALVVRLHLASLDDAMASREISPVGIGDGLVDLRSIDRLRAELLSGEPLWTWPSDRDAHDPSCTAAFLRNVRSIVVDDDDPAHVDLLPGFGEQWLGQPVALLRSPTSAGAMSFALRWHGARPALLWEVEGDRSFTLTCRSIDPDWSTTDPRGEALLEAPVLDHEHVHQDHSHDHSHDHDHDHSQDHEAVAEPPDDGGGSLS